MRGSFFLFSSAVVHWSGDSRLLYLPLLVACVLYSQIFISDVFPNNEIPSGGRRAQETLWLNNGLLWVSLCTVSRVLHAAASNYPFWSSYFVLFSSFVSIFIVIQDQTFLFFYDRSLLSLISNMQRTLDSFISDFWQEWSIPCLNQCWNVV